MKAVLAERVIAWMQRYNIPDFPTFCRWYHRGGGRWDRFVSAQRGKHVKPDHINAPMICPPHPEKLEVFAWPEPYKEPHQYP